MEVYCNYSFIENLVKLNKKFNNKYTSRFNDMTFHINSDNYINIACDLYQIHRPSHDIGFSADLDNNVRVKFINSKTFFNDYVQF